jgi:AcrR family transcriptional regulator
MEKPRRETARGRKTRESIMLAAMELVCTRGYAGTSVDMVCKRAKVVKTAVYWHFGSKAGLMAALVDSANTLWIDTIEAQVAQAEAPVERLDRLLRTMREVITTRSQMLRLIEVVISESASMEPEVVEAVSRLHLHTMDTIASGFEESLGGQLKSGRMLAHTITALMHGIHRHYLLYGDGIDLDLFFDECDAPSWRA